MNINQLRNFYEIYRLRNITRAAEALFMTQQGLSRSVKSLEKELGVPLFLRTAAGVIPTPYAEAVIDDVKGILEKEGSILQKLSNLTEDCEKVLTIDCNRMYLDYFPPGTQAKLEKELFPHVSFVERSCSEAKALLDVIEGEVDFAFISAPVNREEFQVFPLKTYPVMALVSEKSPLYGREALSLKDLQREKIITFSEEWNIYHQFMRACMIQGFTPDIVYQASDLFHMVFLCRENEGIGICPGFYCDLFAQEKLKAVPLHAGLQWSIAIVVKKGKKISPIIKAYIRAFEAIAAEMDESV